MFWTDPPARAAFRREPDARTCRGPSASALLHLVVQVVARPAFSHTALLVGRKLPSARRRWVLHSMRDRTAGRDGAEGSARGGLTLTIGADRVEKGRLLMAGLGEEIRGLWDTLSRIDAAPAPNGHLDLSGHSVSTY